MRFKISEIQANPFRHIDRYPIRQDKIAALRESLRTTGFWDNVVARLQPTTRGVRAVPEIAYGHHRLFALREEYDPDFQVNLIIRDLSDDAMLKIMARENMEEWGTSAAVEHETVRAVVEAFAEGRIELPEPVSVASGGRVRYAPSFAIGGDPDADRDRPYSAVTIAEFLGWTEPSGEPQKKVNNALAALQFIEEGVLAETDFDGLTTKQAEAVVEQARKAKAANEAKARDERAQAERAARAAADAEKRRVAAEKERERQLAQASRAREEQAKLRAEREAKDAERRAASAERDRQQAEARKAMAEKREREQREQGQQQAAKTGRHVSQGLKGGRGYKDAAAIASEVRDTKAEGRPPHIDDFALRLAAKLNKILDSDQDDRAEDLDKLIRFQSDMAASSLRELLLVLDRVAERASAYRRRLMSPSQLGDVIDGEVIEDERPALPRGRR